MNHEKINIAIENRALELEKKEGKIDPLNHDGATPAMSHFKVKPLLPFLNKTLTNARYNNAVFMLCSCYNATSDPSGKKLRSFQSQRVILKVQS